jgi:hypothetical protein
MKPENHQFKLIDNTYSPTAAKEVIASLIQDKIRFLNVQLLSNQERYGSDISFAAKRVEQLQAELERVLNTFDEAIPEDSEVQISCPINVTIRQIEKVSEE